MPNKNLKEGVILNVYETKLQNGTPRVARVRRQHTSIPGRYIIEYLDTGEEERNVSYKRCTFNYDNLEGGGDAKTIIQNFDENNFNVNDIIVIGNESDISLFEPNGYWGVKRVRLDKFKIVKIIDLRPKSIKEWADTEFELQTLQIPTDGLVIQGWYIDKGLDWTLSPTSSRPMGSWQFIEFHVTEEGVDNRYAKKINPIKSNGKKK